MKKYLLSLMVAAPFFWCSGSLTFGDSATWTGGAGDGNWATGANWDGGAAPGSTTAINSADVATFDTGSGTVTIPDGTQQNIGTIEFAGGVGSYTISPVAPPGAGTGTLIMSSGGAIELDATVTGSNLTETIDAPITIEGSLTIANNSTDPTDILSFGSLATISSATAATVTLTGANAGANILTGSLDNGAGVLSLTMSGTGLWTLTGANRYTGATTISAGTLAIGAGGGIASSSGVNLIASGAAFDLSGAASQSIYNLSGVTGSLVSLGANNLTVNTSGAATFAGAIQDGGLAGGTGGSLTVAGTGELILTGTNTYTGGTTVSSGLLEVAGTASLPGYDTPGLTVVDSGGTLAVQTASGVGPGWSAANLDTLLANATFNSGSVLGLDTTSGDFTYGSTVSGSLGLTKLGANTLTLTGADSYTGATTVSAGTLAIGAGGGIAASSGVNLTASGAAFDLSGAASQSIHNLSGVTGSLVSLGANNLTVNTSGAATFAGAIQDGGLAGGTGGSLTVAGTGELILTGTNTYTGGTTVSSGLLEAAGAASLPGYGTPGLVVVDSGGTLAVGSGWGAANIGTLLQNATFASGSALGLDTTNGSFTFSGALSGNLGLTMLGGNTLTLTGANSYTGPTLISAGTLQIGNGGALGAGAVTDNGNLVFDQSGTLTVAGPISGSGQLNQNGSGTTILAGSDSYGGGTTINSGTLEVTGTLNHMVTLNSGTLALNNTDAFAATLSSISVRGGLLTENAANAISGNNNLSITGGTVLLSQANSYSGQTQIEGGVLTVTGSIDNSYQILMGDLSPNGEVNLDSTGAFGGSISGVIQLDGGLLTEDAANAISGNSQLTVSGGTALLSQANNYTGQTNIYGGTLELTGSLGSTGVTITGGTLHLDNSGALSQNTLNVTGGLVTENAANAISGSAQVEVGGSGIVNLSQANNYTGQTYIYGGTMVATNVSALSATSNLFVDGGTFNYAPTSIGNLTWSGGTLTLDGGSIGAEIGGTGGTSAAATIAATSVTASGSIHVNVFELSGADPTPGVYTLISAPGGLNGASYRLGMIYNNTDFTVTSVTGSATAVTATIAAATPITTAYWIGGLSGAPSVWAASNGGTTLSSTNWSTDADGSISTGGVVPGSTTDVYFSAAGAFDQASTTLGASMSILGLTITDATGITLQNDGNTLTVGGDNITVNTTANDTLGVILAGAAGILKSNTGTLSLTNSDSSFTGAVEIDGGIVNVANLADGGSDSALGASGNAASNLVFGGGTLQYNTATVSLGTSTDRLFTLGDANGNNGTIDSSSVFAGNTVSFTNTGAIAFGSTGAAHTLTLTGSNTSANVFAPLLGDDGSGDLTNLTKSGAGTWDLTNPDSSYTGVTEIDGAGILNVASLTDGGSDSSIGAAGSAAANLVFGGGTLQFTGSTAQSTDRLFTLGDGSGASGTIDSSGAAPVSFTNTGALALSDTTTGHNLTLTGSNTGANIFAPALLNYSSQSSVTKNGAGNWILASSANAFTGGVTINGGTLELGSATAIANFGAGGVSLNVNNGLTFASGIGTFNVPFLSGSANEALTDVDGGLITLNLGTLATREVNSNAQYTATYNGVLSGLGGVSMADEGEQTFTASNTYSGGTVVYSYMGYENEFNGPFLQTTLASVGSANNTPFGTGSLTISGGELILAPSGSGAAIQYAGATTAGSTFAFSGGILDLNKGSNASLTYTLGSGGGATVIDPGSTNLLIELSANDLGSGENLLINGAAPALAGGNNGVGMVSGGIVADNAGPNFVTYNATQGFVPLTTAAGGGYTAESASFTPNANGQDISYVTITGGLTIGAGGSYTVYAMDLDNTSNSTPTIDGTLTIGNGIGQAGLILQNNQYSMNVISGGTINFGAAQGVITLWNTDSGGTNDETSALVGTGGLILQGNNNLTNTDASTFELDSTGTTLSGGITVDDGLYLQGGSNAAYGSPSQTFTLNGGGLNGGNGAGRTVVVTPAGGQLASGNYGYDFTGSGTIVSGSTGSTDVITLSGNNSGETGGIVIDNDFLAISSGNNIGSATAPITFNGAQVGSTIGNEILSIIGTSMNNLGSHPLDFAFNSYSPAGYLNVGLNIEDPTNTFTLSQPINDGTSNFYKYGAGTLALDGAYTGTGSVEIFGGTLQMNEGAGGIIAVGATTIDLAGGSLDFVNGSPANLTQNLGTVNLGGSGSVFKVDSSGGSGNLTVNLGTIGASGPGSLTRAGSALDFVADGTGADGQGVSTITTTSAPDTSSGASGVGGFSGIYGGRVVYTDSSGNVNWATSTSTGPTYTLSGYTDYVDLYSSTADTDNVSVTGVEPLPAGSSSFVVNSVKLIPTGDGQAFDLGGNTLTVASGGVLFANTTEAYAIADGTLVAGSGSVSTSGTGNTDLIIQQYAAAPLTISAVIADATTANGGLTGGTSDSTLTKAGPGTLILAAANTYTGGTYIDGGVLSISANDQLGAEATGAGITLNGGTLQATATFGLYNGTSGTNNRSINLGDDGGTIDVTNNSTLTVAGSVNGYGAISGYNGNGMAELTVTSSDNSDSFIELAGGLGNGSPADGITIDGGTLWISGGITTNRTPLSFNPGADETYATFWMNGSNSSIGLLSSTSSLAVIENNTTAGSGVSLSDLQGSDSTYAGTLIDGTVTDTKTLSFLKSGGGALSLTNTGSSYTGYTEIDNGILNVASLALGGDASSIGASTNAAANLIFGGADPGEAILQYTGSAPVSTDRLFTIGDADGVTATIDASGSASDSTVAFTNTGAIAFPSATSAPYPHNLTLTGSNTGANLFAPLLGDAGPGVPTSLSKTGAGSWAVTNANTYSGGTTVSGGTLYANYDNSVTPGSSTGTGTVAVTSGGTLSGTGAIAPAGANGITLAAGGSLAPGGVQSGSTVNGSLTLDTTNIAPNSTILAAGKDAGLTFAVGAGAPNDPATVSQLLVTGGVNNVMNFNIGGTSGIGGTSTVITINDLDGPNLAVAVDPSTEYILIVGDGTIYEDNGQTLQDANDLGAYNAALNGYQILGGLTLLVDGSNYFSENYPTSDLYLVGDDIVLAVPEPSTWALMLGGLGLLVFFQRRRRKQSRAFSI